MARSNLQDLKTKKLYVAGAAEFLGTMFLVIIGCGSCYTKTAEPPAVATTEPPPVATTCQSSESKIIQISLTFGLTVATIVWATAHVSGGHINPAVTFGLCVTRRISIVRCLLYVGLQMLGAIVGGAIIWKLTPKDDWDVCTPSPNSAMTPGQYFGVEMLITFVLVWTVFATVDSQRIGFSGSGPLSIGLSVAICHLWAVPYTGAGMNPARVFGPAVISGMWHAHWAYWVGPLVGGAVAGWLYEFFFAVNATPAKLKGFFSTVNYDQDKYDQYGRKSADDDTEMKEKTDMA